MLPGDKIISALPDWSGRLWFASTNGVVGTVDPKTGAVRSRPLGEKIANSFAVEDTGAVYIVSDAALYRLDGGRGRAAGTVWRKPYANSGVQKPGQSSAGSGTTPTLMGAGLVAITDNADPMNVLVYRRGSGALICRQPVFAKGASATDQSLIGTGRSLVVENNYGYSGPPATQGGKTTSPGLERVDLDAGGGCHTAWRSAERAPSVVPKLSARNGLVYTYTKDPQPSNADAWYLTALDFASGKTVYKRLGGEGLGFNNNYAPVTLGPDGTAYVGTLGGLVALRDKTPPPGAGTRLGSQAGEAAADPAARAAAGPQARAGVADGRRDAAGAARGLHARQEAAGAGSAAAVRAQCARGAEAGAAARPDRAVGRAAGGSVEARAAGSANMRRCRSSRAQEPPDRRVRLPRRLELRHVPAVELDVPRARQRLAHVAGERDRDEPVLPAPDEQRLVLQSAQPGPEAVVALRLVEVDVAQRGVERGAAARLLYARRNSSTPTADQPSRPPGTKRRTTSSITGRGVIWSRPSSGRSAFTSGVHGRPRSHASDGVSPTIRPTRAGLRKPTSNATRPPIELPIRCARSIPQASMNPHTARAKKCGS